MERFTLSGLGWADSDENGEHYDAVEFLEKLGLDVVQTPSDHVYVEKTALADRLLTLAATDL